MSGDHGDRPDRGDEQKQQGDGDERTDRAGQRAEGRASGLRRRSLPKGLVFDDPLDRQTSDDTDAGWGEAPSGGSGGRDLDWYLSQRPPHHGG